ncbi:MAG: hypothetical protein AB7T06_11400 [Kofleriaceae bacterium]
MTTMFLVLTLPRVVYAGSIGATVVMFGIWLAVGLTIEPTVSRIPRAIVWRRWGPRFTAFGNRILDGFASVDLGPRSPIGPYGYRLARPISNSSAAATAINESVPSTPSGRS